MIIITLRFLATGETFESLQYQFLVAANTISIIVKQTCRKIVEVIGPLKLKTPTTTNEWISIAQNFEKRWNFPNCLGAVDGKHIAVKKPPHSGSLFYNYKSFFSIVLLGICDSECRFIHVEAGINGSVSDGGVFNDSKFKERMDKGEFNLPQNGSYNLNYAFVGDGAFKLTKNFMKPYGKRSLTIEERIFNYRLSRPRVTIENAYGILSMVWRVLLTKMTAKIETAKDITISCCILHNLLLGERSINEEIQNSMDVVNAGNGRVQRGAWRDQIQLDGLQRSRENNTFDKNSEKIRLDFKNYFVNDGAVSFQMNRIGEF